MNRQNPLPFPSNSDSSPLDWGEASIAFDALKTNVTKNNILNYNEAETRLKIIDQMLQRVLGWTDGHIENITPEEPLDGKQYGYIDYVLRTGDYKIVLEAKRVGKIFPTPSSRKKLKLYGSAIYMGETREAIDQAITYGKNKRADVALISNGECWIYFDMHSLDDDSYAYLLHPFKDDSQAKELFEVFSLVNVDNGSLELLSNKPPIDENRLISTITELDRRQERNQIARHIVPALDQALYADSLLENTESLRHCFVSTDQRVKYDKQLEIHLSEYRPKIIGGATKIRRDKDNEVLENLARKNISRVAPPVHLLLGPVGVGKSTYLKHFELISGKSILSEQQTHWIYIDFKPMGKNPNPREYMYKQLLNYIDEVATNPVQYPDGDKLVENAYMGKKAQLARGPRKQLYENDKTAFDQSFENDVIWADYQQVETYVDTILEHISKISLCVIVLDNVDLYEDETLETAVFAAGLSLSKRVKAAVIISMRETTYSKHRNNSTINAYDVELQWLNPPDLKSVISKRLTYAKRAIEGVRGNVNINNIKIKIEDLGKFFDDVQRSLLQNKPGHFIESMSDGNVRRGLKLITNFLTSGHVEADKSIIVSMANEQSSYRFPLHEIFKGAILHERLHFKEESAECINVFDSRLGIASLQMLRLIILKELTQRAKQALTKETPVSHLTAIFAKCGVSEAQLVKCLQDLQKYKVIRESNAEIIVAGSVIAITRSGGYIAEKLCKLFIYVEECMFDTAITNRIYWTDLYGLTHKIENETLRLRKNKLRKTRIRKFLDYLLEIESNFLKPLDENRFSHLYSITSTQDEVLNEADIIIDRTKQFYGDEG